MFCGSENILWTNIDILTFAVALTLYAVIHFFPETLWLMMMYHQTKFTVQKIW